MESPCKQVLSSLSDGCPRCIMERELLHLCYNCCEERTTAGTMFGSVIPGAQPPLHLCCVGSDHQCNHIGGKPTSTPQSQLKTQDCVGFTFLVAASVTAEGQFSARVFNRMCRCRLAMFSFLAALCWRVALCRVQHSEAAQSS